MHQDLSFELWTLPVWSISPSHLPPNPPTNPSPNPKPGTLAFLSCTLSSTKNRKQGVLFSCRLQAHYQCLFVCLHLINFFHFRFHFAFLFHITHRNMSAERSRAWNITNKLPCDEPRKTLPVPGVIINGVTGSPASSHNNYFFGKIFPSALMKELTSCLCRDFFILF